MNVKCFDKEWHLCELKNELTDDEKCNNDKNVLCCCL